MDKCRAQCILVKNAKVTFLKGFTRSLKQPTQRGPKFIIVYTQSKEEFVDSCLSWLTKK